MQIWGQFNETIRAVFISKNTIQIVTKCVHYNLNAFMLTYLEAYLEML
jgi:hypothetical protein